MEESKVSQQTDEFIINIGTIIIGIALIVLLVIAWIWVFENMYHWLGY